MTAHPQLLRADTRPLLRGLSSLPQSMAITLLHLLSPACPRPLQRGVCASLVSLAHVFLHLQSASVSYSWKRPVFAPIMMPDLLPNRPHLLLLTLSSTQNLMFEGCTLRPLLPGVLETGVITLRPLLPGVPETGVIRTAYAVMHGSLRTPPTGARRPRSGALVSRGTTTTFFTYSTVISSSRRRNFPGRGC